MQLYECYDVLCVVFELLEDKDIVKVSKVCSYWRSLVADKVPYARRNLLMNSDNSMLVYAAQSKDTKFLLEWLSRNKVSKFFINCIASNIYNFLHYLGNDEKFFKVHTKAMRLGYRVPVSGMSLELINKEYIISALCHKNGGTIIQWEKVATLCTEKRSANFFLKHINPYARDDFDFDMIEKLSKPAKKVDSKVLLLVLIQRDFLDKVAQLTKVNYIASCKKVCEYNDGMILTTEERKALIRYNKRGFANCELFPDQASFICKLEVVRLRKTIYSMFCIPSIKDVELMRKYDIPYHLLYEITLNIRDGRLRWMGIF